MLMLESTYHIAMLTVAYHIAMLVLAYHIAILIIVCHIAMLIQVYRIAMLILESTNHIAILILIQCSFGRIHSKKITHYTDDRAVTHQVVITTSEQERKRGSGIAIFQSIKIIRIWLLSHVKNYNNFLHKTWLALTDYLEAFIYCICPTKQYL